VARACGGGEDKGRRFALAGTDRSPLSRAIRARGRRDPGHPPVALRVYLNPHVDLELTGEAARAYAAADEPGRREMASRLLAEHIEMAGSGEAGVAAGSEILTVQALRVEEIGEVVRRRMGGRPGYRRFR
jgi:hypothetical protein